MEKYVPVVVIKELSETDTILTALKNNGIHTAEITFRTACAAEAIAYACKNYPDMNVGAGTVINAEQCEAALAAGADIVGAEDIIAKIQTQNFLDFDVVITTPDMMGQLGRVAKILGPKGLMPSPKSGTVTMDVVKAINETKAGKVEYRVDKTAIIHCPIGKKSFGEEKITENFNVLIDAIVKAKPAAAKGVYIKSVTLASTMGPGIKVNYRA